MDRQETLQRIADEAAAGNLWFPTNASVALRIRQLLDDPECHIDEAARLVQSEPLLAARVVAIANSVAFNRSGRDISDVRTAVARLGFRTVRTLATGLATRQLAGARKDPAHRALAERLWEHTAHVAALAHVLARRVTKQDADAAMFAGVVHEVGSFYLLSRIDDPAALFAESPDDWAGEWEPRLGSAVLGALGVPEPIVRGIAAIWEGYLAFPPASFGDTLVLADQLAPVESPFRHRADADRQVAAGAIDSQVDGVTLGAIVAESAHEVDSLVGALRF